MNKTASAFGLALLAAMLPAMASGAEPPVVQFTRPPTATRADDKVKINFAVSAPTDVEAAVLDAQGNVLRHLAAGVLGANPSTGSGRGNPPPEPLKPGLAQDLVWDGNDDTGKTAAGPHAVRVRAHMGVKLDGFFAEDPHFFSFPRGLATDKDGNLYLYSASTGNRGPDGGCYLQVFDRTGKYVRTVMPMPANLPPDKAKPLGATVYADGTFRPQNYMSTWPVLYGGLNRPHAFSSTIPETGALHFVNTTQIARLGGDGGAVGTWFVREGWPKGGRPSDTAINWLMTGPGALSVSPDGKTAYVTGLWQRDGAGKESFPPSRIYKADVENGSFEKFADLKESRGLAGSATDKDGNLLVCDPAAGRVVVLGRKGEEIGEIKAPQARHVACHRKTGAVYVLSAGADTGNYSSGHKTLAKFSGWKDGKEECRIALTAQGSSGYMALDDSAEPAVVWVAVGCTKGGAPWNLNQSALVFRLEERDGKFVQTAHEIKFPATPARLPVRLAVHPQDDKVICRGEYCAAAAYEGLTGNPVKLPFASCLDMGVGLDGNWYLQPIPTWAGPLNRFDRDLKPMPGKNGSNQVGFAFGRFGQGLGSFGVTADQKGRVYSLAQVNEHVTSGLCVVVFGPDGKPEDHGRPKGDDLIVKEHDKFQSALISRLGPGGNIAVDWNGNVYVGLRAYPLEWKPPAGFENDTAHWQCTGSVVKFPPEGGGLLPLGGPESRPYVQPRAVPEAMRGVKLTVRNCYPCGPVFVENALRAYPGLSCLASGYGSGCACRQPMFQLDGWGRLFIPNALDCSVQVVDNEGNEILRFGEYGNADSRGVAADSPMKKPEVPLGWPEAVGASYKAIYVADVLNRRIVRLLKTYGAEETIVLR